MRLAPASDRHPGPLRPRNGNRIWLVTCIVTVIVAVFVVLKVTGSSCPADPRAAGSAAVAGGASPDRSTPRRTDAGGPAADGTAAGGTVAGGTGATAPAASPALAGSVMQGQAVFYDPGQAAGSCGLGPFPAGGRYASLPPRSYASGRACGSYLDVSGPRGAVRAEVVDVCTGCAAGTVNLSRAAFTQIADPRTGMVVVSYRATLDPPLPGPLMLRISAAVQPGTLAVQVINHGNRLSSVAVSQPGGRWQQLTPSADGYWIGPLRPGRPSAGQAPAGRVLAGAAPGRAAGARIRVRVTDVAGHQVVLTGITGRRTVLHTTTWMYRSRGLAGAQATPPPGPAARAGRHPGPAGPLRSC